MSQIWDLNQNHTYAYAYVYEYICVLWREIGMWTHACSQSPDCELQDAPMISAIGARGESIYSTQSRVRAKSPHFDGLVHVLWTGLRICTANRIRPESPFHVVFENTIKSRIGCILSSLHHFWSKRCDFCDVRHLVRSKFLMDWNALNNLYAGRRTNFWDKNRELYSGELFSGEEFLPISRFFLISRAVMLARF